jgi:hypothetical protein
MLYIKITIYKEEIRKRLPILLGILVVSSALAIFSGWNSTPFNLYFLGNN